MSDESGRLLNLWFDSKEYLWRGILSQFPNTNIVLLKQKINNIFNSYDPQLNTPPLFSDANIITERFNIEDIFTQTLTEDQEIEFEGIINTLFNDENEDLTIYNLFTEYLSTWSEYILHTSRQHRDNTSDPNSNPESNTDSDSNSN